jgi:hypothetical protein
MKVWRVTEDAPSGKWIDVHTIPVEHAIHEGLPEAGAWAESSFDLLLGADVTDTTDTVPTDLLDELFGPLPTTK